MLRDFGILTVVDLGVSLVGVMIVLPAALLWAEEHGTLPRPGPVPPDGPVAQSRDTAVSDHDDRFEDLSPGERLAERDRHPSRARAPARRCRDPATSTPWLVGILMLMGLAVLLFAQTLPNKGKGLRGPSPASCCPPSRRRGATAALRATRTSARGSPATRTRGPCRPATCAARASSSSARASAARAS